MSTWHYLECVSHEPALRSTEEVEQHAGTAVLDCIRDLVRLRAVTIEDWLDYENDRYVSNAMRFVANHPHCAIDLVTEYGDREHLKEQR